MTKQQKKTLRNTLLARARSDAEYWRSQTVVFTLRNRALDAENQQLRQQVTELRLQGNKLTADLQEFIHGKHTEMTRLERVVDYLLK